MMLEIVIGTMIASTISIILMNALGQMTKVSQQVDEMYERSSQLMMIHHQFERDIIGMCVPLQAILKEETTPAVKNESNQPEKQSTAQKKDDKNRPQTPIKKVFYASNTDTQQMQQLTFITNNPLPRYWQGTVGSANPKIARISYYLEPSKDNPQSLILMRKESSDLNATSVQQDNNTKAYAVASHIQSFSLTFSYETVNSDDKKTTAPKTETAQVKEWNSDELLKKNEKKDPKQYNSLLPRSITISGSLWNQTFTHTVPFCLTVPILSNGFNATIVYEPKKDPSTPNKNISPPKPELFGLNTHQKDNGIRIATDGRFSKMPQAPTVQIPFSHIEFATN